MHEMASNGGNEDGDETSEPGGDEPMPSAVDTIVRGTDGLAGLIEPLRDGDLAFVFTVVAQLGAVIADHPDAPAGATDRFVQDVALVLADLAAATTVVDRPAAELLATAIRACHTPSADCGPETSAAPDGQRPDERSV